MKTEDINNLVETFPALRDSREKLHAMQDGAYCEHKSWGFGQIQSYDAKAGRLLINFLAADNPGKTDKRKHPMAPEFCVKHLEIFPAADIRVRQKTEPKVVEKLIKNEPAQLVKEILLASPSRSMSGIELEKILTQVIGLPKYKKWWAGAKKHVENDPDIATPEKKDGYYILREEPLTPGQEILEEYKLNKNALQKILLAEKLYNATVKNTDEPAEDDEPDEEVAKTAKQLKAKLANIEVHLDDKDLRLIFDELTTAIASAKRITKPDATEEDYDKESKEYAARLHGIWVRNDLCRHLQEDVDQLAPTSRSIIEHCREKRLLPGLAERIPQTPKSLKRLLDLITRVYPDEAIWKDIILDLLQKSTGKFTSECVNFLVERGHAKNVGEKLFEWLYGRELLSPVLAWVVKNRASVKHAAIVTPLINHRLLSAILQAVDAEAIRSSSTRRIPLAEELSADKTLIPDLLGASPKKTKDTAAPPKDAETLAAEEEARGEIACDLAQSLNLSQGFDPLTKKSLLARFIGLYDDGKHTKSGKIGKIRKRVHEKLQSLVAGETEQSEELVVSQWSLDARRDELRDIIQNKIPENKKAIAIAKEHGDLKENSEYKMARQDQETLAARRSKLETELGLARVTAFIEATTTNVGIGSIVELLNTETGKTERFTILGAWDSDPDKNILSYKTPLAQQLFNKATGDIVQTEIGGNTESWKIKSLARWVDTRK
ncbi:MAG: GreA/GreB family elongation factor [Puniceicoccales bacterium]|jgi:transcription elongation GreA/GreB family factor|nr:GreA/GreB family elongation factor [Puniceicoccales bacterium]